MATRLFAFCLPALLACNLGSGTGARVCPETDPCGGEAGDSLSFVTPQVVHTGHNGRDNYQAVLVTNFGNFNVSSSDEGVVAAECFECLPANAFGIAAVLTTAGSGSATVTVSSGGVSHAIGVEVASYTAEQYDLGDQRYNNPANANSTDRVACADCHLGQGGAPHSPLSLGGNTDAELISAVLTSSYPGRCEDDNNARCDCQPSGTDCSACPGDCRFNEGDVLSLEVFGGGPGDHTYNLTDSERVGVMAFMRAIRPEGI
jgi:hypothetical protein